MPLPVRLAAALLACVLGGCLSEPEPTKAPVAIAGMYSASVMNGMNGCGFANFNPGVTSGIPVNVEQVNERVRVTVAGGIGFLLNLWVGSNLFEGTIEEDQINVELHGTVPQMLDECSYRTDAVMQLDVISENQLDGEIVYTVFSAGDPDCASLEGCSSVQTVTALRDTPTASRSDGTGAALTATDEER